MNLQLVNLGVPAQLLMNRPDIRQAERELEAAGLDVKAARARFFPQLAIAGPLGPNGPYSPVGFQAFNPKYLFWTPEALLVNTSADMITPLVNKKAIQADYKTANATQLRNVYNYQRVILNAYTEVVNRVSKVEYYRNSIEVRKQQVEMLNASVTIATDLFNYGRSTYVDVLFAQRDLWEARLLLIETKQQQLSAVVGVYQALGGGLFGCGCPAPPRLPQAGPSLAQSPQGGSGRSGYEQLQVPPRPEQPPAPVKPPEQPRGPNTALPDPLLELGTLLPPLGSTP